MEGALIQCTGVNYWGNAVEGTLEQLHGGTQGAVQWKEYWGFAEEEARGNRVEGELEKCSGGGMEQCSCVSNRAVH